MLNIYVKKEKERESLNQETLSMSLTLVGLILHICKMSKLDKKDPFQL